MEEQCGDGLGRGKRWKREREESERRITRGISKGKKYADGWGRERDGREEEMVVVKREEKDQRNK